MALEAHSARWILVVVAAFTMSLLLRALAYAGTRRAEARLLRARRTLGLLAPGKEPDASCAPRTPP